MRAKDVPTETQDLAKLDKQLKYANKLGIPKVVIIGEQELAEGKYTLKDMQTGEQQSLSVDDIINSVI